MRFPEKEIVLKDGRRCTLLPTRPELAEDMIEYLKDGFPGSMEHYDGEGYKIGETRRGLFGELNHYDEKGNKVGHSTRGLFGEWKDYGE